MPFLVDVQNRDLPILFCLKIGDPLVQSPVFRRSEFSFSIGHVRLGKSKRVNVGQAVPDLRVNLLFGLMFG